MAKQRTKERIVCEHFPWLLGKRGDVYTADGRSNQPSLGRHSLGTKNYDEAIDAIKQLDLVKAIEVGKIDNKVLEEKSSRTLGLQEGVEKYNTHISRPRIIGGAKPATKKRYRAVINKFIAFANKQGIKTWNGVTKSTLEDYASWLDGEGYAYATEYLELMTLKQIIKWFV